jgi:LAO/AO transport system kinase
MTEGLVEQVLAGSKRAVARLITRIENDDPLVQPTLSRLFTHTGRAHLIGITGAPGTGKSSLVKALARYFRGQANTVAIIAVDPTSPFSGGAILGDSIRMQSLCGDPNVFIRSMASRGNLGGLARAASDVIKVLDAAGFDIILIETVGAGQSEVEIARAAQTIIVVEAPGLGDHIQAIKAGILEIADIFVVNKADRDGANRTIVGLKAMLELGHAMPRRLLHHGQLMPIDTSTDLISPSAWEIPVLKTVAIQDEGITEVGAAIEQHRRYLADTGELAERERARLSDELVKLLQLELTRRLLKRIPADQLSELITKLVDRTLAPYNAVQLILEDYGL